MHTHAFKDNLKELKLQDRVERDAVNGRFEDRALMENYQKELLEAREAIEASLARISGAMVERKRQE